MQSLKLPEDNYLEIQPKRHTRSALNSHNYTMTDEMVLPLWTVTRFPFLMIPFRFAEKTHGISDSKTLHLKRATEKPEPG